MNAVLVKRGSKATLNLSEPGKLGDYARRVTADEVFDGIPVSSYADGVHALHHYHAPAAPAAPAVPPKPPVKRSAADDTVVYEKDRVVAYFNDHDHPAHPSMATHCLVWGPGGVMKVVSLRGPQHGAPTDG